MNAKIERVLDNPKATAEDYFNLVNHFEYALLSVKGAAVDEMDINEFRAEGDRFEFLQKNTNTRCCFAKNVASVVGGFSEEMDTFYITAEFDDGVVLNITIMNADNEPVLDDGYYRLAPYELKEYLKKETYVPVTANFTDLFALRININNVESASVADDDGYTLYITDGAFTMIAVELFDDVCNEIALKEGEFIDKVVIKPYGQPFAEVTLMINKVKAQ